MIIPTAEPFLFPGNRTGCLLVHGFTGAPKEMRWMGEYLSKCGYTILGVRLAGHATQPEDMNRMHWEDWIASIEDGYFMLQGMTDRIFIIGLSLGGILSLTFAAHHNVAGVVAMSTPYDLPADPRMKFIKILAPLVPKFHNDSDDWHNPEAAKDHVCYPFIPTRGIIQLRDLLEVMRTTLSGITVPVLLIHSRNDTGVLPPNAEKIYAALGSQQKQLMWVVDSGHVITREPDREIAFKATDDFIKHIIDSELSL